MARELVSHFENETGWKPVGDPLELLPAPKWRYGAATILS